MNRAIFKSYTFTGKHAKYVNHLVGDRTNSFFKSNISLFIAAALLGISMNLKSSRDENTEEKTKIESETLELSKPDLWYVLQLAVINNSDEDTSVEQRLKRLYENAEVPSEYKLLLESYVFAGIEYFHEHLWQAGMSSSEKITKMVAFVTYIHGELGQTTALDIVVKADETASSS